MMSTCRFIGTTTRSATLVFSGLTVGQNYLLQVLAADERTFSNINFRYQTYEIAGHVSPSVRQGDAPSMICRFAATSASETLFMTASNSNGGSSTQIISGVQLRAI
jgi:hypothetical protein